MERSKIAGIVLLAIMIYSCNSHDKKTGAEASQLFSIDTEPGTCPYLTKNANGELVAGWARMNTDSSYIFCYATSADNGNSFSQPVLIPGSSKIQPHGENLPKLLFKPSGEIIALWGVANPNPKNKYSGLVYYSQSFDKGTTWTAVKPLVSDTVSYDQRYFDIALLPNGEAAVIWLDNRKSTEKEGSSLYYASTNGKNGFENEKRITEGCCECCRTDLFIDSKAGIHVLYRGILKDSIRDMLHSVSKDGGKNFSTPKLISNDNWVIRGCPHTGPAMTENKEGLNFAWFTGGPKKGCYFTKSADNGNTFTGHDKINGSGSHPQVSVLSDQWLAIVWDEPVQVKEKYFRKIGLQLRSPNGQAQSIQYVTPDTVQASYPVISSLGDQEAFIAFTVNREGKDQVMYEKIKVK
jgi:hypothetical protein